MSFIPYTPQIDLWVDHFSSLKKYSRKNGMIILENGKMQGEGSVKIISPTV